MLDMNNTQNIEFTEWYGRTVPMYVTTKHNPVIFTKYGWCYLHGNPSTGYDNSEVNEIWKEWSLYWNGV